MTQQEYRNLVEDIIGSELSRLNSYVIGYWWEEYCNFSNINYSINNCANTILNVEYIRSAKKIATLEEKSKLI